MGTVVERFGGTFESRYAERVAEFQRAAAEARAHGRSDDEVREREVEYLLDSMSFIREYETTEAVNDASGGAPMVKGSLANFVEVTHKNNKNNVLQRYLLHVENTVDPVTTAAERAHQLAQCKVHPRDSEYLCSRCNATMVLVNREAMLVCERCGECKPFNEMNAANLSYEEQVELNVVTHFSYKRHNHFCEWLNSLQAKASFFGGCRGRFAVPLAVPAAQPRRLRFRARRSATPPCIIFWASHQCTATPSSSWWPSASSPPPPQPCCSWTGRRTSRTRAWRRRWWCPRPPRPPRRLVGRPRRPSPACRYPLAASSTAWCTRPRGSPRGA